ncbi:MAG: 16S rRNA (uracil(1498)-N(3))-methyltransferase [Alphaproteobacteria bacterium]|nr:16S rRNA (uracil(1498)-N(3))-methyltransferase [Alphaproteobacteria bacterium]
MRENARVRLFVQDDLREGATIGLSAAHAHYLRHVMRRERGDPVALFNGRDGEWRGRIDGFGRGWCSLALEACVRRQTTETDLWLLFAPIKRARLDFLVQKAVELGVSSLRPVFTQHTDVTRVNTDRLCANVAEAAEQCERLTLPDVAPSQKLADALADWPDGRRLLVCVESGEATPLDTVLHAARAARAADGDWAFLIGPEGGFAPSELDGFRKLPFLTSVSLGPRILRSETAAIAALACWQSALGDWHIERP